ncbi:Phenol 2-monooxygenase [Talaromyces islandicus]|uniref:Phenol 2-monooxygenase n=1 Tax=Talaromyces islandicus TaxID=28573 RepID=A0A0U1M608_TALIS|nr:Phenol 2-monooxygenase [Talaromyces islandicus]
MASTDENNQDRRIIETEFLIVGAGPAGASLACFLAFHGFKGIVISAAPGTADTPRAHITNMAAIECLRDIGLEQELKATSSDGESHMLHTRWCHSMAGEEYARVYSWGNDPVRKGDYVKASPCSPVDIPQTLLEPILVRYATHNGFSTRFNTKFLRFDEDAATGKFTVTVRDTLSNFEYQIRTKYLFGADGARSRIVKQLDLPLYAKPGQGLAINVLVKADLSHLVQHRKGNLHYVFQPDRDYPDFGWWGIVRMVKPWNEWMFILFTTPGTDFNIQPSNEEYLERVKELIGDNTPAEILSVSKWFINETVAEEYSRGNVFCLGDAVHRHPPFNGLGSNTCIQDAYNLAWKIAYVEKGIANPSLLSTYITERQPVGFGIITRANQSYRSHFEILESIGQTAPTLEERVAILDEFKSATPNGVSRRKRFQEGITQSAHEFHGLGIEMGQHYTSTAVYDADETAPYVSGVKDEVLDYIPSTYPGSRLPHAWLNKSIPVTPISTQDLAGHGTFSLFTGIGGGLWHRAAAAVLVSLNVKVNVHVIGFRQEWEDVYHDWTRVRGVEESGAVLARPDRFVAWRAREVLESEQACLKDVGSMPYSVIRPILLKVESPAQLREIEKNSPHIMEDDRELWISFIKRDVPRWEQYELPKEPPSWYDIYTDLVEQVQREVEEDALRLKKAVDKIDSQKSSIFVKDSNFLPQRRRGWKTFQTRSEPKKTSIFNSKRNKALAVPTHRLNSGASEIRHVPQWLVDEHKQPLPVATPRRPTPSNNNLGISSSTTSRTVVSSGSSNRPQMAQSASRPAASPSKTKSTPDSRTILTPKRPTVVRSSGDIRAPTGASSASQSPAPPAPAPIRKRAISNEPKMFMVPKRRRQ